LRNERTSGTASFRRSFRKSSIGASRRGDVPPLLLHPSVSRRRDGVGRVARRRMLPQGVGRCCRAAQICPRVRRGRCWLHRARLGCAHQMSSAHGP
jgi:hypothetical protein